MKSKYSLRRQLLIENEMEQMQLDFEAEPREEFDSESSDLSAEESIPGDLEPEDLMTEPDLLSVAEDFEELFNFMESLDRKSKKKYSLLESTAFPRELSGGAGAIMVMMANFNIGLWTNVDSTIFAGQPILSYAQASGAQINALNTFFGAQISKGGEKPRLTTYIASGAAKPSSGVGADLEMNDSGGKLQLFEVKSDVSAKGSTKRYSLLKEFTSQTVKEFNKTPGLKKLGLKASLTPIEISKKIDSMSKSDFTKFKKALVTKMAGEALLVPNYTTGVIYGASNADVVAALLSCSKSDLRGKRGYSDTRNGIKFPVDCTIKAKAASMPSHVLTSFNEMLKQARKAGYNVAEMIKKDYPKESNYNKAIKKWNDARKAMDPPKNPNKFVSYSAACDTSAKSNKTNDIRAFLTAKGKKTFLSYGTYKLLSMKGGGQSAAGWNLVMSAVSQGGASKANPNPAGDSGDGTSKPPRRSTSRRTAGKTDSKPAGKTFTGYRKLVAAHVNKELGLSGSSSAQLKIKIAGEESGVSAFVKSKFNSGDVDILNKIVAKEIAHEVKKGSGDYTAVATKSKRKPSADLKDKGMSKRDMWSAIKSKSAAIKAQFGLGNTSPWRGTTIEMRKYYDWAMGGTTDPKPDPKPRRRTDGKTDKQSTSSKIARPYDSKKIADSEMKKHKTKSRSGVWKRRGLDKFGGSKKNQWDAQDLYVSSRKNNKAKARDDGKGTWAFEGKYSLNDRLLTESLELENGIDAALELMQTYGSDAYNIDDAIADLEADGLGVELAQDDPQESSEFRPAHAGDYMEDSSGQRQYAKGRPSSFDAM